MTPEPHYAQFWCEENVWHLVTEADQRGLHQPHAVFISSQSRAVAMWEQKAAPPGEPIVWDYHVVLAAQREDAWVVVDLDCRRGDTLPAGEWIEASFPMPGVIPPELEPSFRIVAGHDFLATFQTDRSHMVDDDGSYRAPPPPWPALAMTSNIWQFVAPDGDAPGSVIDLEGLRAFLDG